MAVAAGTYTEDVKVQRKPVKIWGRCPGMVEVKGTGAKISTLDISGSAVDGTDVRGIAVTGAKAGITIYGASDVDLDHIWIHDTGERGVDAIQGSSPAEFTLTESLIERAGVVGVSSVGVSVTVERSAVRATKSAADGTNGRGIEVSPLQLTRSNLTVRGSVIEKNHEIGIVAFGSDAFVEATVVRDNLPSAVGGGGFGILAQDAGGRANVTVLASVVEKNQDIGIDVVHSDATIRGTVVRERLNREPTEELGFGINAEGALTDAEEPTNITVEQSLVAQNHEGGISIVASDAVVDGTVVRATLPSDKGGFGVGVAAYGIRIGQRRSSLTVRASEIAENSSVGIQVEASDAVIERVAVRGNEHYGIELTRSGAEQSNLKMRESLVENNSLISSLVLGSNAQMESSVVRETLPNNIDGSGPGIIVATDGALSGNLVMHAMLVEKNRGAGVYIVGSDALVEATVVRETQVDDHGAFGRGIVVQADPEDARFVTPRFEILRDRAEHGHRHFRGWGGGENCRNLDPGER